MSVRLHKFLPQQALSRGMGWLADRRWGAIKNWAISFFIQRYQVDMAEAELSNYRDYATFNEFFTRRLKVGSRPISEEETAVLSPVDGKISAFGHITDGQLLQAKGKWYSLVELFGGHSEQAALFQQGHFFTAYLAPPDYHRFHMPVSGRLLTMIYVPGRLFSVNAASVNYVPHLFGRNERVICLFETSLGPMAVIAVGAMIVGGIATVWSGTVTPPRGRSYTVDYHDKPVILQRGDEMGYFKLGSTIILLFPENTIQWKKHLKTNTVLRMGEKVGEILEW